MSQIRTRAELERAWLNKKINYQKDKSVGYRYSFECKITDVDIAFINTGVAETDMIAGTDSLEYLQNYGMLDLLGPMRRDVKNRKIPQYNSDPYEDARSTTQFIVMLINPFSHDAVSNPKNKTDIKVDWGDGTRSVYKKGTANIFPFSDIATIYQNSQNNRFKFNDKLDTDLTKWFNLNTKIEGTYIGQKAIFNDRYSTITNDREHIMHDYSNFGKFKAGYSETEFTIKVTSHEFVVPVLVCKRMFCGMLPMLDRELAYTANEKILATEQYFKDMYTEDGERELFSKLESIYNVVRDKQFVVDKLKSKILTEENTSTSMSRPLRDLLMTKSLYALSAIVPIVYGIDGTLPPALYGNIADDSLGTAIVDSSVILDEIKHYYINEKPEILNYGYNEKFAKAVVMAKYKEDLDAIKNVADDIFFNKINDINREIVHAAMKHPVRSAFNCILSDKIKNSDSDELNYKDYHIKTLFADGLEKVYANRLQRFNPTDTGPGSSYHPATDKDVLRYSYYNYYSSLGLTHRQRFIASEEIMDKDFINKNKIAINPFMYLPTRESIALRSNARYKTLLKDPQGRATYRFGGIGEGLALIGGGSITQSGRLSSGVLWDEIQHVYMGAFIDKVKVTGIPIYMYKLRDLNWATNRNIFANETCEAYVKRLLRKVPMEKVRGSKYESGLNVLLSRGDWFYNSLQYGKPEIKTIQEMLLDIYLKGFISKEDISTLYQEIPITIINPFKNVNKIGSKVFTKMLNTDRLDGFFCNMFMHTKLYDLSGWYKKDSMKNNLESIKDIPIKKMSYVYRCEGTYYGNSCTYPKESLLSILPKTVEEVDVLMGYSDIDYSFTDGNHSGPKTAIPFYLLDNIKNEHGRYEDRKLKKISNAFLFCNIIPKLYTDGKFGVKTILDNISVLYGWRHLTNINHLFSYCNLFGNAYISIRDIALRPKDEMYVNLTPNVKNIELSKIIHNCHTISDLMCESILDNGSTKSLFSHKKVSADATIFRPKFESIEKYDLIRYELNGTRKGNSELNDSYLSSTIDRVIDPKDYSLSRSMLKFWGGMELRAPYASGLFRSTEGSTNYYMYTFGLSKENEVKKYGLGFLFLETGIHPVYKEEIDTSIRFTKVNNYAEGYMRTYTMMLDRCDKMSMHKLDGLIQQSYQHCYLDGYNKANEVDGPYFTLNIKMRDIDSETVSMPRCNSLLFGRWNTPMGWMFLSGALNLAENKNYLDMWNGYGLNGRFVAACDLTNIEGLFYNVGPLATDLYPQMEIHDYDDFIDIETRNGDESIIMSGHRFGFCAEKESNVFTRNDVVYNWKNLFKNDTYYYASATDPLAQITSMDAVTPEFAKGEYPENIYKIK